MNVLMISLDANLVVDEKEASDSSQRRHIYYGKYLKSLFIVTFVGKRKNLNVKRLSSNVIVYPICYTNPFSYLYEAYKICCKICKENKIDLITAQDPIICGLIGYFIKILFKIPLNIQIHGDYIDNKYWLRESRLNYFLNIIGKFILRRADTIRVVSTLLRKKIRELGIYSEKIVNIPLVSGIDHNMYVNANGIKIREKYLSNKFKRIVLFVGRLTKSKNLPNLLKAIQYIVKENPEILFLIVGDGEERKYLIRLSRKLKIEENVAIIGPVPFFEVPQYYNACDLFVLPSNYEGLARVLVEAAIAGKPIIATDVSGVSDVVINNITGYIIRPNDPIALANAIRDIINNVKMLKVMGRIGRKCVYKRFNINLNVKQLINMWIMTVNRCKKSVG